MTSSYTDLGVELMVTGENAGTWGTKTNNNLNLIEQISGGYITQAIAGSGTTPFAKADGALNAVVASRIIVFTGALTGSRIITFPVLTENFYIIKNATSNAETLQLKAASGSGSTVTWATDDKGWKLVYFDGVATNTGVVEPGFSTSTGDVTLTGTQTLTNKTLTSPKINENVVVTSTATELNILDGVTATAAEINYSDLATLGTSAASKVITANANNLTTISGAVLNTEDALTDAADIVWNVVNSPVARVTLTANRNLSAPTGTGIAAGQMISLLVIQDAGGTNTITWNAVYEFPSDTAPTLTSTGALGDLFSFRYNGAKWLLMGQTLALTLS